MMQRRVFGVSGDTDFNTNDVEKRLSRMLGSHWTLDLIYHEAKPEGLASVWRAISADNRIFAVKRAQNPYQTGLQYNALKNLALAHPECVEPVFLAEDNQFFVMEWKNAPTLRERMHANDRLTLIKNAGRWLAGLHRSTRSRRPYRDISMEKGLLTGDARILKKVNHELTQRRRRLWFRASRVSLLHTDFQPNNLFVEDHRMIAFDPALYRRGNRYFDVAHFLLGMRIGRLRAKLLDVEWPDNEQDDNAAFLEGYGKIPRRRKEMFRFTCDLKLARMWRRRFDQQSRSPVQHAEFELLTNDMRVRRLLA